MVLEKQQTLTNQLALLLVALLWRFLRMPLRFPPLVALSALIGLPRWLLVLD
eukprot:SAG11_NODE_17797_length_508_cov_1.503667_1_plen_51_part_10